MKIAVVGTRGFPDVQGGVEKHCEKLYPQLAKSGCHITVFTRKPYIDTDLHAYKDVSLVPIDCTKNKYLEAFIHTFKGILKARRLDPDILHIHAIGPSIFAPLARFLGMKVVVTHHGPDYKRGKWPLPAKLFLRFCEWIGIKCAHEIIAIAQNIADDIQQRFGRGVTVIPNGVDIPLLTDKDNALRKYGVDAQRYFLGVGRFVPEKGFDVLMDAFNECDLSHWKLVIVGDADHMDKYSESLKEKAEKSRNIVLTGFLTGQPLHELYCHAGIFILPSYYEGLPIALLEAMSYGLSCIASDIPANRNVELSSDRFFKTGEIKALAQKIEEFMNKSWSRKDAENQVDLIAEKYNWGKIADETFKVYMNVVSR
jgi:glycosyltransferase involved in cell wall biosynthesis